MHDNKSTSPIILGPWPDLAAARLFLGQMVNGNHFSEELPDLIQLADWLNYLELGAFAYTCFQNDEPDPQAEILAKRLEPAYWAGIAAASIKLAALQEILLRLRAEGIDCTLFKGAAFGLTIYAEHAVRRMNDMDLWIQKRDVPVVWRLFREMGYQDDGKWCDAGAIPNYVSELSFYPDEPKLSKWNVEVHWDLLPQPGLMGRLPLEVWWQRRRHIEFRDLEVKVLDPADALVHACIHQMVQHRNQIRLRWLLDIDRLVRGRGDYVISPAGWQRIEAEFSDSEIWPAIQAGVQRAAYWLATPLPEEVNELLAKPLNADQQLFYLFYAIPNMTIGRRMLVNLQGKNNFRYRVQMMLRFLFPWPKYMMERYGVTSRAILPLYYVGRILMGIVSFLRSW